MSKYIFEIGDIVALKSHPLAFQDDGLIDMYINQIPPFICVKEIHIERKKQVYSEELGSVQVSDQVKYLGIYFNQHRMIFEEKFIYESMLTSLDELTFHSEDAEPEENHKLLIDETKDYSKLATYEFGKRVFFKTYKLEKRKKFETAGKDYRSLTKTALTHTSPAFLLNGLKRNEKKNVFNNKTGEVKQKYAIELFKVLWYNSYQEKFSEAYLPKEFFTDDKRIYSNK